MNLSPHFTFEELTETAQTALQEANRVEARQYLSTLQALSTGLLEPIRMHFGKPVHIHSGFRGPALNKAIGGSKTSQHMKGEAADFHVEDHSLQEVFDWIKKESGLKFGQLILEGRSAGKPTWIHISLGEPWRPREVSRQTLVFDGTSYKSA